MLETQQMLNQTSERLEEARAQIAAKTPKSKAHSLEAKEYLAQEVIQTMSVPHPVYISESEGPYIRDVDGNEYVDMAMGFGAHVLGHRPRAVVDAVSAQLNKGWQFGVHNSHLAQLGELICKAAPSNDRAVMSNSGTEATMYAMRVARAHTGKTKVMVFDGNYHGAHDYAMVKADYSSNKNMPEVRMGSAGVPASIGSDLMVIAPYCDEATFELIEREKDDLALVSVQPVQNNNPNFNSRDWLKKLRDVCTRCNVLLHLDEVVSGFRLAYGGCQELFDIEADLVTYGKGMGGGFPIGVTAGKKPIMDRFHDRFGEGGIMAGGTFNGNPLSALAGSAVLAELLENKSTLYPELKRRADELAKSVNGFAEADRYPLQILNAGSMFCLHIQDAPIKTYRDVTGASPEASDAFYLHLLNEGVLIPGIRLCFISAAHKDEHVEFIAQAMKNALVACREDGFF